MKLNTKELLVDDIDMKSIFWHLHCYLLMRVIIYNKAHQCDRQE